MNRITWISLNPTESLVESVISSLKSLKRFNKNIIDEKVVLSCSKKQNPKYKVEFIVPVKGALVLSESTSNNMYEAIKSSERKIIIQLKKIKDRKITGNSGVISKREVFDFTAEPA